MIADALDVEAVDLFGERRGSNGAGGRRDDLAISMNVEKSRYLIREYS